MPLRTKGDEHRPSGHPRPREHKSQKAQLISMPHGSRKDFKRGIAYKTGLLDWKEKAQEEHRRHLGQDLQGRIQALLDSDKDFRSYGLRAEVSDGNVLLTGIVDTLIEKERLTDLIRSVPGVKSVENGVTISTDGPITDTDVAMEVAQELEATPHLDGATIYPEVTRGTVTLNGQARDNGQARAASLAASKARGVKRVINRIKTTKPRSLSLEAISHNQVRNNQEQDNS